MNSQRRIFMLVTTFTVVVSATLLPAAGSIHGEFSLARRTDGQ
jgi:hypothetical protein